MKNIDLPRVGFAAFAGILVGSVVAMNLGHYFWWVGVLLGVAMGVFALGPIRTLHALVQAGSIARRELCGVKVDIKAYCSVSIANLVLLFQLLMLSVVLLVLFFGMFAVVAWFLPANSLEQIFSCSMFSWIVCVAMTLFLLLIINELPIYQFLTRHPKFLNRPDARILPALFFFFLISYPFIFPLWGVPMYFYLTYLFFSWIFVKTIPAIGKFSWKFAKMFFLYIHSEETVQVSTYVAIGTVLGWYFKAPFSAAVIGGVVGELSYRFLTLRFLNQKVSA